MYVILTKDLHAIKHTSQQKFEASHEEQTSLLIILEVFQVREDARNCIHKIPLTILGLFCLIFPEHCLIPDLHRELFQGVLKSVTAVASDFILVELKSKKHLLVVIMCVCQVILVTYDSATLWTIAHQAPMSMGFSRQDYWSRLLCPPPGDLPNPGIGPACLTSPALAGGFFTTGST